MDVRCRRTGLSHVEPSLSSSLSTRDGAADAYDDQPEHRRGLLSDLAYGASAHCLAVRPADPDHPTLREAATHEAVDGKSRSVVLISPKVGHSWKQPPGIDRRRHGEWFGPLVIASDGGAVDPSCLLPIVSRSNPERSSRVTGRPPLVCVARSTRTRSTCGVGRSA
jgi:hypothetical protein